MRIVSVFCQTERDSRAADLLMISAQLLADCITVLEPARLLILVLAAVIVRLFWFSAWPEIFLFRFFSFQPSQPTLAVSLDCEEAHADIAGMASSSYFLHLAKAEAQAAFWLVINFYVSWILHSEMVLAMLARFVLSQQEQTAETSELFMFIVIIIQALVAFSKASICLAQL